MTNTKIATKFRALAERLEPEIQNKLHPSYERMPPTRKRLEDAEGLRKDGRQLQRVQAALRGLADHHEAGTVPELLASLTSKEAVRKGFWSEPTKGLLEALVDGVGLETPAQRLKALENKLLMQKIPGFFPTPAAVVERMIELAGTWDDSDKVCDPEAGTGALLDVIRSRFPKVSLSCIEINYSLREVLTLKGYTPSALITDFMEASSAPTWDKILMNPPFENGQDMQHIQHAFGMLRPGGVLVSVISPGPFFRSDRRSVEFREWFEAAGGRQWDLPENSFIQSGTGVASKLVRLFV